MIIGALITAAYARATIAEILSVAAVFLASLNIFGGFTVSARMLAMFKKKDRNNAK